MTATSFIILVSAYAAINSLVVEALKQLIPEDKIKSYNLLAMISAIIIGIAGTFIFYQFNSIALDVNNVICAVLLGLASGLSSMVGYDKVKQTILQVLGGVE